MKGFSPAAGLASLCLLVSASACSPARHEPWASAGDDPPAPSPTAVAASASSIPRTPAGPAAAEEAEEPAESPFAPMLRGSWRDAQGNRTYRITVDGSRFVAVEFQKDREIGRYEGRLRGRQVDATYVSSARGPVEGRAALELSNDGSRLAGAFTFKEQFTPIEWVRNAAE